METADTHCCNARQYNNRIAVVQLLSIFALQKLGLVVNYSLSLSFFLSDKIIIDLSNQLCDGKKVQEKHNKLNCVDYEAGIVQTLMLTCSRNFSISPFLSLSLRVLLWLVAGDVGTRGDATWGS